MTDKPEVTVSIRVNAQIIENLYGIALEELEFAEDHEYNTVAAWDDLVTELYKARTMLGLEDK